MTHKFAILVPVHGRYNVLRLFDNCIKRLQSEFDITVVAVGSSQLDRNVCEELGYTYTNHKNNPLGGKLQAGLQKARELDFDACIMLGSDDILSNSVVDLYNSALNKGYDFIGFLDCYFYDLENKNMRHWKGYTNERRGEPIGAWRCLSRELLDRLDWNVWDNQHHSVDYQMWQKVNGKFKILKAKCEDRYRVVDLKTKANVTKFTKFPNSEPVNAKQVMMGNFPVNEINEIINF